MIKSKDVLEAHFLKLIRLPTCADKQERTVIEGKPRTGGCVFRVRRHILVQRHIPVPRQITDPDMSFCFWSVSSCGCLLIFRLLSFRMKIVKGKIKQHEIEEKPDVLGFRATA